MGGAFEPLRLGTLAVTNGTGKDGVAVLFVRDGDDSLTASRAIYVRAGDTARFDSVDAGRYVVRFMLGGDWRQDQRRFSREVEAYEFTHPVIFNETQTADGVVYSSQTLTLHKVPNGNAPSKTVDLSLLGFDRLTATPVPVTSAGQPGGR